MSTHVADPSAPDLHVEIWRRDSVQGPPRGLAIAPASDPTCPATTLHGERAISPLVEEIIGRLWLTRTDEPDGPIIGIDCYPSVSHVYVFPQNGAIIGIPSTLDGAIEFRVAGYRVRGCVRSSLVGWAVPVRQIANPAWVEPFWLGAGMLLDTFSPATLQAIGGRIIAGIWIPCLSNLIITLACLALIAALAAAAFAGYSGRGKPGGTGPGGAAGGGGSGTATLAPPPTTGGGKGSGSGPPAPGGGGGAGVITSDDGCCCIYGYRAYSGPDNGGTSVSGTTTVWLEPPCNGQMCILSTNEQVARDAAAKLGASKGHPVLGTGAADFMYDRVMVPMTEAACTSLRV